MPDEIKKDLRDGEVVVKLELKPERRAAFVRALAELIVDSMLKRPPPKDAGDV